MLTQLPQDQCGQKGTWDCAREMGWENEEEGRVRRCPSPGHGTEQPHNLMADTSTPWPLLTSLWVRMGGWRRLILLGFLRVWDNRMDWCRLRVVSLHLTDLPGLVSQQTASEDRFGTGTCHFLHIPLATVSCKAGQTQECREIPSTSRWEELQSDITAGWMQGRARQRNAWAVLTVSLPQDAPGRGKGQGRGALWPSRGTSVFKILEMDHFQFPIRLNIWPWDLPFDTIICYIQRNLVNWVKGSSGFILNGCHLL